MADMILAASVVAVWLLWVAFVAIMYLRRVRDRWGLTSAQKVFGYPLLIIGYVLDVALRLTVASALFLRVPQWETVSALLEREAGGTGWRKAMAHWVREDLLADFDPTGSHGKPGR